MTTWLKTQRSSGVTIHFNPWRGCTKISPGCTNCYAETMSHRNPKVLGVWGDKGTRVIASESYWRQPLKWDREAAAQRANWERAVAMSRSEYDTVEPYERPRVFCASLADVFEDRPELDYWRQLLWDLAKATPNLDWLLLTKRPENFPAMVPWGESFAQWPNVWLGVSVEDQARADERIPLLLQTPAAVRFLLVEPLLSAVSLDGIAWAPTAMKKYRPADVVHPGIDLVIVGGESGPGARVCGISWIRSIVEQCRAAQVPCFVKQLGSLPVFDEASRWAGESDHVIRDRNGGDPAEWPADLRVRQFPKEALP